MLAETPNIGRCAVRGRDFEIAEGDAAVDEIFFAAEEDEAGAGGCGVRLLRLLVHYWKIAVAVRVGMGLCVWAVGDFSSRDAKSS